VQTVTDGVIKKAPEAVIARSPACLRGKLCDEAILIYQYVIRTEIASLRSQ